MPVGPLPPLPLGPEFRVPGVEEAAPPAAERGGAASGFSSMLGEQLGRLTELDAEASEQARALATGEAEDVASVVMAVERASLAFQLAAQVRNKAVEAYHDVFRMQI